MHGNSIFYSFYVMTLLYIEVYFVVSPLSHSSKDLHNFALNELHNFFFFRILQEDVRIGLPAGWRKGVWEERCFMKGKCVLLINFLLFIYLISLISILNFVLSLFIISFLCNFFRYIFFFKIITSFNDSFNCLIQIMYLLYA